MVAEARLYQCCALISLYQNNSVTNCSIHQRWKH